MARKYRYLYNFGTRQKSRWYLWAGKGHKKYRVEPQDPNFRSIYGDFLKGIAPDPPNPNPGDIRKPIVHTFGWGVRQYYKGHPFINWSRNYQNSVRNNLDPCLEELVNSEKPELGQFEDAPIDKITLVGLEVLRDRKLAQKLYGSARNRVRCLKYLFKFLKRKGYIKDNPALDLERIKTPKEYQRRHTWTDGEIAAYRDRWPIGSKARLAFELHYHYLARADVVRVGPANVKVRHGIKFLEGNRKKTGEGFKVAMSADLLACIESTPPMRGKLRVVGASTFLVTAKGPLQYDEAHYGSRVFRAWCRAAGLPQRCTPHGIRRAKASHRAHDSLTTEELNAEAGVGRLSIGMDLDAHC